MRKQERKTDDHHGAETKRDMNACRRRFFNLRAEEWMDRWYKDPHTGEYTKFADEFRRLFSILRLSEGDLVLDVGCGSGILVPHILERIGAAGRLYELDYAGKMIDVNKRLHPDKRITFITADILDLPLDDASCDLVICFACFPHLDDKQGAMRQMARVLKENGRFAIAHFLSSAEINDHHRKAPEVMHDRMPEPGEIKALFKDAGITGQSFIDEGGFYLAFGRKPSSGEAGDRN